MNVIQVNVSDTFIPSNSEFTQARFSHPEDGGSTFPQNIGLNPFTTRRMSRQNVGLNLH